MGGAAIILNKLGFPGEFSWVLAVATSTGFLTFWQSILVSNARKRAGIKYPAPYATTEEAERSPAAKAFNCTQRAHGNTLESLPFFLFSLIHVGIVAPRLASGLGATWVVGRVLYTLGYSTGNPSSRQWGVVHNLGFLGLMVSSAYVSFKTIF